MANSNPTSGPARPSMYADPPSILGIAFLATLLAFAIGMLAGV